jgi:hypothetical protein
MSFWQGEISKCKLGNKPDFGRIFGWEIDLLERLILAFIE